MTVKWKTTCAMCSGYEYLYIDDIEYGYYITGYAFTPDNTIETLSEKALKQLLSNSK